MTPEKTHREVKNPQISGRFLADYMGASETRRRTIVRDSKYQPIGRVVQHNEAKGGIGTFWRAGGADLTPLKAKSAELRGRLADTSFDRDLFDHNADYLDRFITIATLLNLPDAEFLPIAPKAPLDLNGVKVTADLQARLRRLTKTNKVKVGAVTLRYSKGHALPPVIGEWQSAFLFGYVGLAPSEAADTDYGLCVTVDAYSGACYSAPTNSVSRFKHMESACATIAERWPNIAPPPGAIL